MNISGLQSNDIQQLLAGLGSPAKGNGQAAPAASFNDMVKVLTTQLKNQDPTNPLDMAQFTQQIATLSGSEQQSDTNSKLDNLISLYTANQVSGLSGYIGRRVEASGNQSLVSNGQGLFVYDLPQEAAAVQICIAGEDGKLVYFSEGDTGAGRNELIWDGKNSFTGEQMPDGIYTFVVKALAKDGTAIAAKTYTTGRVSAVDLHNGRPTLLLQDHEIPLEAVLTIREDPLQQTPEDNINQLAS